MDQPVIDQVPTDDAPRSLRVNDEPVLLIAPIKDDGRRLTTEYLINLAQGVSDETIVNAVRPVQKACFKELQSLCSDSVRIAQSVYEVTNRGTANRDKFVFALRSVNECLVINSEVLSKPCLDTIIAQFINDKPSPTATPTAWPDPTQHHDDPLDDQPGSNRRMRRHHHRHHRNEESDSSDPGRGDGVAVYVINNNGASTESGGQLDYWGDRPHHGHHHHHHGCIHPMVWLLILPFFCVGLYVSAKHAFELVKRRRGSLPFATPSQQEYVPLKAPETAE